MTQGLIIGGLSILCRILLIIACIGQFTYAIQAEANEEYTRAAYEMLWLFFFLFIIKWQCETK